MWAFSNGGSRRKNYTVWVGGELLPKVTLRYNRELGLWDLLRDGHEPIAVGRKLDSLETVFRQAAGHLSRLYPDVVRAVLTDRAQADQTNALVRDHGELDWS